MSIFGAKFVRGEIDITSGHLLIQRSDDSIGELLDVVMVAGIISDNGDSTFDVNFSGS